MRWSVYQVVRKPGRSPEAVPLGYVNAPHSIGALDAAFKRWPKARDMAQPQAGFSVRPYASDHMSLGKQAAR